MSWNKDLIPEKITRDDSLIIDEILYHFDGPQIFVSKMGFLDAIFLKVEENDDSDLFISARIDQTMLEALKSNRVSVRAAFDTNVIWIVETIDLRITRYWICDIDDLPEDFLPEPNVGLDPAGTIVPDTLTEATAYFSISFKGKALNHGGMPFGMFKQLMDNAYEATRNILSPALLAHTKSSTFDFRISEPRFSSLVVALQEPIFNEGYIQKKSRTNVTASELESEMVEKRLSFFEDVKDLIIEADSGIVSKSKAEEKFDILDQINNLVPSDSNALSDVIFSAATESGLKTLHINKRIGEKLQEAYKLAEDSPVVETGTITVLNWKSSTFVINSTRGKEVTCQLSETLYDELQDSGSFNIGVKIRARGKLTNRAFRDFLVVSDLPILLG